MIPIFRQFSEGYQEGSLIAVLFRKDRQTRPISVEIVPIDDEPAKETHADERERNSPSDRLLGLSQPAIDVNSTTLLVHRARVKNADCDVR